MRPRWVWTIALLAAGATAIVAVAGAAPLPTVKIDGLHKGSPELIKTLPISGRALAKKRVVMSLDPSQVGSIVTGDRVEGLSEVEVSVTCLESMSQCVGRPYDFSPHIMSRLYLTTDQSSRDGYAIGDWKKTACSQHLPNRNHHCVIVIDRSQRVKNASKLPCAPNQCHLNLVMSAYHPGARKGNVLVVGADENNGSISQDKGRLTVAAFRPGDLDLFPPATNPLKSSRRLVGAVPVGEHSASEHEQVVYSVRVGHLQAGDQLVVKGDLHANIGSLNYSTLIQSQLILSEHRGSVRRNGAPARATSDNGIISAQNGFNCTQGPSPYSNPCPVHKLGHIRILKDVRTDLYHGTGDYVPLYVNLVVAFAKEFGGTYHSGDRAKIGRNGSLRVYRYTPEFAR